MHFVPLVHSAVDVPRMLYCRLWATLHNPISYTPITTNNPWAGMHIYRRRSTTFGCHRSLFL